ncbi:MAG TPA: glycosyltransferase [Candidatus Acidoferrum sp.]|nr:glycosyltransferase [Candidatus Acidoferrum sp.]
MKNSRTTLKKVLVVIPCYNEAASIARVISKFPEEQLLRRGIEVKVCVVDNNSTDNTAAIARSMGATVIHEPRKGKGNALRAGFSKVPVDTDYVVMLDGDDTYDPGELLRLLEPLQNNFCDAVVGSRLSGHIDTEAMSKLNYFGNRCFTTAVRFIYHTPVTDVLTGYFAWKKPTLDALRPHIKSAGFAIEMEMITKMARLGHRIISVPIGYHPRGGSSHLHPFRDGCRILSMLLKNIVWWPHGSKVASLNVPHPTVEAQIAEDELFIPRKIVFVSDAIYPYMKGGKEKRLFEITKRLVAMGHDVHIYTMHWWEDQKEVRIEHGVFLHALCGRYEMYKGNRRTIKEGVLFGLACFKLLRVQFDVLDVDHMPFFPIFSAWIVCLLRGRKLYATWHEALSHREWTQYMGVSGIVASMIEGLSIRLPHRITAASAHTKELLASAHGRVERVELVASGIDTALLNKVPSATVDCDVLYVGRLVKDKHVDKLVQAIGLVREFHPAVRCVIIGQGLERSRLEQEVARLDLDKNVTFLDPLPEAADVYAYMKAAKVFCSPSVREGFGIASLEALGCGTPVITIDSPSNAAQHLITNGQNGSIVPLTPAALSQAIVYWISATPQLDIASQVAENDWSQLAKKQAEVYML